MFTGLVQHLGSVIAVNPAECGARLLLDATGWNHRPGLGESVAVNGCCLSVAEMLDNEGQEHLALDVIAQTLSRTTLGDLVAGEPVNLEHAATPTTLLGGHIVQGHIDGVGTVQRITDDDRGRILRINAPQEVMETAVPRGSIAVDGVSLTIAETGADFFEVALIPSTIEQTTLGAAETGRRVNLEADYLARVVINWLRRAR